MSPPPGRALGIDYGSKRIGYAVSDEMGWAAQPLEVWTRRGGDADLAHLAELVGAHEIVRIVIGLPLNMDGSFGPAAERASAFVELVRVAVPDVPVTTRDEGLTTFEAKQRMVDRGIKPKDFKRHVDAYAAAVILDEDLHALNG